MGDQCIRLNRFYSRMPDWAKSRAGLASPWIDTIVDLETLYSTPNAYRQAVSDNMQQYTFKRIVMETSVLKQVQISSPERL